MRCLFRRRRGASDPAAGRAAGPDVASLRPGVPGFAAKRRQEKQTIFPASITADTVDRLDEEAYLQQQLRGHETFTAHDINVLTQEASEMGKKMRTVIGQMNQMRNLLSRIPDDDVTFLLEKVDINCEDMRAAYMVGDFLRSKAILNHLVLDVNQLCRCKDACRCAPFGTKSYI